MTRLHEQLSDLVSRAVRNHEWRQRECFNLIPSEMTPSLLVRLLEITDPSGRYAEHRTQKGEEVYYYQGVDFIREVEEECQRQMADYFGCPEVELRPISGQMSNEVVYKAMTRWLARERDQPGARMRRVVNHDLQKGGHLSAQPMGALFNYVDHDPETGREAVVNFPVEKENPYRVDVPALLELLPRVKPDLVIFGKSMFLHPDPVKEVSDALADEDDRPVLLFDMAHVLGLYGAFQRPFEDGADLVTGSTHKTFFGPQRGVVAGNLPKGHVRRRLWIEIKNRAFPGSTSNHHLGTLLGLLAAAYEMNAHRASYQEQVRKNAKAFARALHDAGVEVEGDPASDFTDTHQVVCRVRRHGIGEEVARRLEDNHIVCNYQALPDDESFQESSGIRLGVAEMTRFGMVEPDFEPLAGFMADVIVRGQSPAEEVARYRQRFTTMQYCLPVEESLELAARLIEAILPDRDAARQFGDLLAG